MIDPVTISLLTTTTVKFLIPYFQEAIKGFAKEAGGELGKSSAGALIEQQGHIVDALKLKFQGKPHAQEALEDLSNEPDDEDNQAAVRKEIKKIIESEPDFAEELKNLLKEANDAQQGSSTFNNEIHGNVEKLTNIGNVNGNVSF